MPLLTLKRDTYHEGKEDAAYDHKLIEERLLTIAVPDESPDGRPIKLEDCLQGYFNTRVEVDRYKFERSNTKTELVEKSIDEKVESPHGEALHVEVSELVESNPETPITPTRITSRDRTNSLLYRYKVPENADGKTGLPELTGWLTLSTRQLLTCCFETGSEC